MKHKSLIVVSAVLGIGCSSSNDNTTATNPNDSGESAETTVEFSDPDINGSSDLARLSYPVVRDLSRELVTANYLESYFGVDKLIGQLLYDAVGGVEAVQTGTVAEDELQPPFDCPERGTVSVSFTGRFGPDTIFSATFADCGIDGRTLTGSLLRDFDYYSIGAGSSELLALTFDALTIDQPGQGLFLISGTVNRGRTDTTPEMLLTGERGSCALDASDVHLTESSAISSAMIEREGIAGAVSVSEASYERDDNQYYDATSDEATCPLTYIASENGNATVTFSNYGASMVDGSATVSTANTIDIDKDADAHTASQLSTLPDGSSMDIRSLADMDGKVQVDIEADGMASSFVDSYRFVAPDFEI